MKKHYNYSESLYTQNYIEIAVAPRTSAIHKKQFVVSTMILIFLIAHAYF